MIALDLGETLPEPRRHWSDYVRGVSLMLARAGIPVGGSDLLIRGDVPLGAGISSSASLEVAVGLALTSLAGRHLRPFIVRDLKIMADGALQIGDQVTDL